MNSKRIAGLLANTFDWFDQAVMLALVPVFSKLLFPASLHHISIVWFYVILALTYLVRPIGAIVLGHCADKLPIHKVLFWSLLISGVCFFLVGCLPVSQSHLLAVGITLILLRLIHGFMIGGVFSATNTYLFNADEAKGGFNASFAFAGFGLGVFLALAVNLLMGHMLTAHEFYNWGWRALYWSGVLPILLAFWFRFGLTAPTIVNTASAPILDVLSNNLRNLIILFFQSIFLIVALYQVVILLPVHLREHFHFHFAAAFLFSMIAPLLFTILVPFMGRLTLRYEATRLSRIALVAMILFAYPLYGMFRNVDAITTIASIIVLVVIISLFAASLAGMFGQYLSQSHRTSGTGLAYNLAYILFGGSAPLFAIILAHMFWSNVTPALYMIVVAIIALVLGLLFTKPSGQLHSAAVE